MSRYDRIFSPFGVRNIELRNRVVVPPLVQVRPITSPEGLAWYRRLASGGAGMVIVEATNVERFADELSARTLGPLVEAIHSGGAAAVAQLFPGPIGRDQGPDDLAAERVEEIIAAYGKAAAVCRDAGFEGVEPHGAHSYLLHNFFKPDQNHRDDRFGGSLEGRSRFGVEIVRRMREAAGEELLILFRHTPTGAEYGIGQSLKFAARLVAAGLDVLDVSPASEESVADLAAPLKAQLGVPVIAVGGMEDAEEAETALGDGRCDLVALGRQMIADARWPDKVGQGRQDEVLQCVKCNKCHEMMSNGEPVRCVLWADDEVAALMQ
ncbi:MAG: hypothetical protein GWP05_02925 [Anaerolineaceae bacterium]|nr:hypothetical protein [Anaerolineaceae bacterium]